MFHGIPLIYAGQESGARVSPSLFERQLVDKPAHNNEIFAFYRRLIHERRSKPAIRSRTLAVPQIKIPDRVLAFEKYTDDETILVVLNFSSKPETITIPDQYRGSESINLKDGYQSYIEDSVKVGAYGVCLIKKQSAGVS